MKKFIKILAVILALSFVLIGCDSKVDSTSGTTTPAAILNEKVQDPLSESAADNDSATVEESENHQRVKFTMDDGGVFIVELYPEYAPKTVENFVNLVSDGFYDGLTFHRVVEGFMAQGGDPEGTGMGGSNNKIKGEFAINGFTQNTLSHTRGVISMARSQNNNSASSQFFICYGDATFLDGSYAAFGRVIEGMEVVDSFLEVERVMGSDGAISKPVTPITIEKAEVLDA